MTGPKDVPRYKDWRGNFTINQVKSYTSDACWKRLSFGCGPEELTRFGPNLAINKHAVLPVREPKRKEGK